MSIFGKAITTQNHKINVSVAMKRIITCKDEVEVGKGAVRFQEVGGTEMGFIGHRKI